MAFHDAGVAAALARADDIHVLAFLEDLVRRQDAADLEVRGHAVIEAELADIALRLAVRLLRNLDAGLLQRLAPLRFEIGRDMATLGADGLAARLVLKAELHGRVLIAFRRA